MEEYDLIYQEMLDAFSGKYEADYIRMQGDPVEDWYEANRKPTVSDRIWTAKEALRRLPSNLYWKAYALRCRIKVALYGEVEVPF
jgi:hypothetical protein